MIALMALLLATQDAPPDRVFLLIGQSNMAGRAPLEQGDDAPIPGVFLLDDKGKWEPARNPLNRYATDRKDLKMQKIGPGYGFALAMRKADPKRTVGLLVNARGGSKIEQWAKGQKLYDNMLKRAKGIRFAGVLWHQGESNAGDGAYLDKLVTLVATLRKDLGDPNLPFVAGRIGGTHPVNDAIDALPGRAKRTAVASADGLKKFDTWHFDRAAQVTLGSRYAEAWLKLQAQRAPR